MFAKKCVLNKILLWTLVVFFSLPVGKAFSQDIAVLKVTLNGEDVGEFFVMLFPDGDVFLRREDLDATRLEAGIGRDIQLEGEVYVSLSSIPEVTFRVIFETATLKITAPAHLFKRQRIAIADVRQTNVLYPRNNSAFVNYGIFYSNAKALDMATEIGVRAGRLFGTSTFSYSRADETRKWTRLLSSVRTDNVKAMRTMELGDVSASSGLLGTSLIIGGINLRKNFETSPYFIPFPALTVGGTLETPSEVAIYVNDRLIKKSRLAPGEFLVDNVPAETGPGVSKIVITDIFGTKKEIATPFYYTNKLLRKGLHEYSYSVGLRRDELGDKNFSYGDVVSLAFHKYGFSDGFTGGYTFEASKDVINVGPTASLLIGRLGVLESGLRFSFADGQTGVGAFLSNSYKSKGLNAVFALGYHSPGYRTVSAGSTQEKPSFLQSSIGVSREKFGSLSVSYAKTIQQADPDITRYGLSYSRNITRNIHISGTAARNEEAGAAGENQFFLTLHFNLSRTISGNVSYSGNGANEVRAGIRKNLLQDTGYGFSADVSRSDSETNVRGDCQYQTARGVYGVNYAEGDQSNNFVFSAAGGIGYIDKALFLSRPITDSFAKVKVGGLPGVQIFHAGNESGTTDAKGEFFIPNLNSFHENRISISQQNIPMEYAIQTLEHYVSPPFRSGVVVDFQAIKTQAFTGTLLLREKEGTVPVEYTVLSIMQGDKPVKGLVGKNGEFYFENIPAGKYSTAVQYQGRTLSFIMKIPESDDVFVNLGEIVIESR